MLFVAVGRAEKSERHGQYEEHVQHGNQLIAAMPVGVSLAYLRRARSTVVRPSAKAENREAEASPLERVRLLFLINRQSGGVASEWNSNRF